VLAALALSSCGSVFQGSSQRVRLDSEPDSARFEVDGYAQGVTPATLHLDRTRDHVVTLKKSGYERDTVMVRGSVRASWAALDIVSGILPVVIDGATGNWRGFDHSVHSSLTRLESAVDSAADDDTAQASRGRDWVPSGQTIAVLNGRVQITCRSEPGPTWVDRDEAELRFSGATVSKTLDGTFRPQAIRVVHGSSFYLLLPSEEIYRVRVAESLVKGVTIEWSRK
jgi:hypothetical protein